MQGLRVFLLGGFRVEQSGEAIRRIASRPARLLFAHLLLNKATAHPRSALAGLFWPDQSETVAKKRLSNALWQINSVFSEPVVVAGSDSHRIDPTLDIWVDAVEFERIVTGPARSLKALRVADDLYRGELLSGFYDDWVLAEQDRFRRMQADLLRRLARAEKTEGDFEAAETSTRRLLEVDPLDEEAYRECMRLLTLMGRAAEAIAIYDRCAAVLEAELGIEPGAETSALVREIAAELSADQSPFRPGLEDPSERALALVGRTEERARLVRLLDDTLGGTGGVVFVEGAPGIGKTRLIEETAADARWRGFDIAWVTCGAVAQGMPFGVVSEMLTAGLTPLRAEQVRSAVDSGTLADASRLAPSLGPTSARPPLRDREETDRFHHAVVEMLSQRASLRPLLVVVDDLHYADEASLAVLARLASYSEDHSLLFIVSFERDEAERREAVWSAIRELDRSHGIARLQLEPLLPDDAEQLARAVVSGSEEVIERAVSDAAGNPLFLLEAIRAGSEAESAGQSGRVADVISRRLAALGEAGRAIVGALAVLDDVAALATLRAVAHVERSAAAAGLEDLLAKGIAVESDGRFGLVHRQVCLAAYAGIEPGARRVMHERAARVLEQANAPNPAAVAHHYRQAGLDEEAAQMYMIAADVALDLAAYDVAADHLGTATRLLPAEARFGLLEQREKALDVLGRRQEQQEALAELAELAATPEQEADVIIRQVNHAVLTSRTQEAEALATELLRRKPSIDREADLLTVLGRGLRWAGQASDAAEMLARATELADPAREAEIRTELGASLIDLHDWDGALAQLISAQRIFDEDGDRRGIAETQGKLGIVHFEQGAHRESETALRAAIDSCSAIGYRYGLAVNMANLGTIHHMGGRPALAIALMNDALAVWRELGDLRNQVLVTTNLSSLRLTYLGPSDSVHDDSSWALAAAEELGNRTLAGQNLETLAWIEYENSGKRQARRTMERARQHSQDGDESYIDAQLAWSQALLEWESGSPRKAQALVDELLVLTRDLGFTKLETMARGLAARFAFDAGDLARAAELSDGLEAELDGVEHAPLFGLWRSRVLRANCDEAAADNVLDDAYRRMRSSLEGFDEETQQASLERVRTHRELRQEWLRRFPEVIVRPLVSIGTPTGRPVKPEEMVEVALTAALPTDFDVEAPVARRSIQLQRLTAEAEAAGASVRVEDLADLLGVSPTTVKRDLAGLRRRGVTLRTRGNA